MEFYVLSWSSGSKSDENSLFYDLKIVYTQGQWKTKQEEKLE